ncbi:erv26 super protein [Microbotryomycetes sp. JL221]|nr:erv26 super protein [Microbotryomycetes sp. JL221]
MVSGLHCLSYVAGTAAFVFVLLSLASGLLYVAEVIEEHSSIAKVIGQRVVYCIILVIIALHFADGLPLYLTTLGVYFSERARAAGSYNSYNRGNARWNQHASHYNYGHEDTFVDVATYFGVCVWLTPFFLFLSLSANDNVLPSAGESQPATITKTNSASTPTTPSTSMRPPSPSHSRKHSSMMKTALSSVFSVVPRSLRPTVLTRGSGSQRDGLIATPLRSASQPGTPLAENGPKSWPMGSPSPSLAYGFPPPLPGSNQTSPVLNRSNSATPGTLGPSAGGGGSLGSAYQPPSSSRPIGHQGAHGLGLRSPAPPAAVRRHTTEEGVGLGVAAGMTVNTNTGAFDHRALPSPLSRVGPNIQTGPASPRRLPSRPGSPSRSGSGALSPTAHGLPPSPSTRASFSGPSPNGVVPGSPRRIPSSSSLHLPQQPASPRRAASESYPAGVSPLTGPPVPGKPSSMGIQGVATASGTAGTINGVSSGQRISGLTGQQANMIKRKAA